MRYSEKLIVDSFSSTPFLSGALLPGSLKLFGVLELVLGDLATHLLLVSDRSVRSGDMSDCWKLDALSGLYACSMFVF